MLENKMFRALFLLLLFGPPHAGAATGDGTSAVREQNESGNELTDETIRRELELFRGAEVSLRQALKIADGLHPGSRIVDVSFDGGSGSPIYRVKTFRQDRIWEDAIDAKTGQVASNTTVSSLKELDVADRLNLIAMRSVRQELADAVFVAEGNTSGKALSVGLMTEAGRLNFVIVVLSGVDLKQVILEPPVYDQRTSPRHSREFRVDRTQDHIRSAFPRTVSRVRPSQLPQK